MPDSEWLGARYEVLRTVSCGRRASVLQALDHLHDRLVALKVYPVTDDDRDELLAEARLLMHIDPHPSLPVVRDDFFDDRRYVVVMNWVDGTDLQHVLEDQGGPGLPLSKVIDDLSWVAEALDHLHAEDPPIVHGDIKPANLVRTPKGRVVLVDFDIAGAHAGKAPVGTVGFVAPEVAAGEKPGPAADVFGLAATAITLLNGRPPTEAEPTYPGIDPSVRSRLARVLRASLATDPTRRPGSAGELIQRLRVADQNELPSGFVALLATEVADAGRLWAEEPDEMRIAMRRLRDVTDEVVAECGGTVVTSMNEGDRTIAVFREAAASAVAALGLHDRVASEPFPPETDVRLRIAIAAGEVDLVDGVYAGALVDHVLGLRWTATPSTSITSEPTAELLVGLVGSQVSIVPLGTVTNAALPQGTSLFALTRPGAEHTAKLPKDRTDHWARAAPAEPISNAAVSRRAVLLEAIQHPLTLGSLTVAGLALIYVMILSSEVGVRGLAMAALVLATLVCVASFVWQYARGYSERQRLIADETHEREAAARARDVMRERAESRRRIELEFARVASAEGRQGESVLAALCDEFESITELLERHDERPTISLSPLIPDLAEETYRHGMSALSDALELFEFADGPSRRRLEAELREIEERLERDGSHDDRARERDEQRRTSHRQLLARHDEGRQRARDLMFEAERCTSALAETRIELASVRAGDTRVNVDAVVQTLQETIHRVRDVQDELRRLGY
jgi:hypothetical protein